MKRFPLPKVQPLLHVYKGDVGFDSFLIPDCQLLLPSQGFAEVQVHQVISDHPDPKVDPLDDPERLQHAHIAAVRPRIGLLGWGKGNGEARVSERCKQNIIHGDEARGDLPRAAVPSDTQIDDIRGQAAEHHGFAHGDGEVLQTAAPRGGAVGAAHAAVLPLARRGDLTGLLHLEAQPAGDTARRGVHCNVSLHRLQLCWDGHFWKGSCQREAEKPRQHHAEDAAAPEGLHGSHQMWHRMSSAVKTTTVNLQTEISPASPSETGLKLNTAGEGAAHHCVGQNTNEEFHFSGSRTFKPTVSQQLGSA